MIRSAYAKINLTLDILGKRTDGYHEIESIVQQISLADTLEFEKIPHGIEFHCDKSELENKDNLSYLAAALLQERYKVNQGVIITLQKNIPVQAGLGGGSADCAVTLTALNELWELGLTKGELILLGAKLGSDVPCQILGGTCLIEGRGEKVSRVHAQKGFHVVVVVPDFGVSTKEAYADLKLNECGKVKASREYIKGGKFELHNDFEYSLLKRYPKLADIREALKPKSLVSGSGSAVYGLFETSREAEQKAERLRKDYSKVFVCEFKLAE